jgi:hypothetical protein
MRVNTRSRDAANFTDLDEAVASDPQRRSSGVRARAERVSSSPAPAVAAELPQLSIATPASESMLEPTYAYLSAYCFAVFGPAVAQRLNVAVYELFANALRHGTPGSEVRIELYRAGRGAVLTVQNRASEPQRSRLRRQIERVQADPSGAFQNEMNRFVGASQPAPMLGIVRVAHEAGMPLELGIEDDVVELWTHCE